VTLRNYGRHGDACALPNLRRGRVESMGGRFGYAPGEIAKFAQKLRMDSGFK
jgi:hypothetical protein